MLDDELGWRDRAIALAALGAAAMSRRAFLPLQATDPSPVEMQVLVGVATGEALLADPSGAPGVNWLATALRLDEHVVDVIVRRLADRGLLFVDPAAAPLFEYEGDGDPERIDRLLPIVLTGPGRDAVEQWLRRVRWQFRGWPAVPVDVDDAT